MQSGNCAGEGRCAFGGSGRFGIHQQQFLGPGGQQRIGYGRAGSADAQLQHRVQRGTGQAVGQRPGEAGGVGVVAVELAVADDHGVHRADGAGPHR